MAWDAASPQSYSESHPCIFSLLAWSTYEAEIIKPLVSLLLGPGLMLSSFEFSVCSFSLTPSQIFGNP